MKARLLILAVGILALYLFTRFSLEGDGGIDPIIILYFVLLVVAVIIANVLNGLRVTKKGDVVYGFPNSDYGLYERRGKYNYIYTLRAHAKNVIAEPIAKEEADTYKGKIEGVFIGFFAKKFVKITFTEPIEYIASQMLFSKKKFKNIESIDFLVVPVKDSRKFLQDLRKAQNS